MKPTPYNGCAAYTKNHVKCGAYVQRTHDHGARYCPTHKNYARDWFAKHPPLYGLYRADIVRRSVCKAEPGSGFGEDRSRVVKEYIDQFRTEAIIPSRYYVYNIAADAGNYLYYYLLCEHCPSVDPLWNQRLFKDVLWFQYRRALDNPLYVKKFLQACRILAKNAECVYFIYNMLIPYSIQYLLENVGADSVGEYYTVFEKLWERLLNEPFFGQVALSEKMKEVISEHKRFLIIKDKNGIIGTDVYDLSMKFLTEIMEPTFENWRGLVCASLQSRAITYKEELVAEAWHPRRVERWIELCGLEAVFDRV